MTATREISNRACPGCGGAEKGERYGALCPACAADPRLSAMSEEREELHRQRFACQSTTSDARMEGFMASLVACTAVTIVAALVGVLLNARYGLAGSIVGIVLGAIGFAASAFVWRWAAARATRAAAARQARLAEIDAALATLDRRIALAARPRE